MADLPEGPICRVAVLPFLNKSAFPQAEIIVNKVFAAQLQTMSNYIFIQEGDVLAIYRKMHILPMRKPSREQLQIIASRIGAQLMFTGTVVEMREDTADYNTVNPLLIVIRGETPCKYCSPIFFNTSLTTIAFDAFLRTASTCFFSSWFLWIEL